MADETMGNAAGPQDSADAFAQPRAISSDAFQGVSFLQDLQGEVTVCRGCKRSMRVVPIVMLHDQDETRRFEAVFSDELPVTTH